jgi:hypothetical protein
VIDWTHDKIAELIALVRFGAVLVAVVSVAYAYAKTRSLVTLLVAALTAGIFLWAVNNTAWWQQRVEDESGLRALRVVEIAGTSVPGQLPDDGRLSLGGWRG